MAISKPKKLSKKQLKKKKKLSRAARKTSVQSTPVVKTVEKRRKRVKPEVQVVPILLKKKSVRQRVTAFFRAPLFWLALFTICLNVTLGLAWYTLYQKTVLSFAVSPSVSAALYLRKEVPRHVTVPSEKIDLNVVTADIKNGIWETSQTDATYLSTSARPGEGGNVVIYGHNWTRLFGKLAFVKLGDTITLTTNDGKQHEYKIAKKFVVSPNQVDAVLPTDYEMLTLYTCTGLFDSQRLMIQAFPTKVS